jgi:vacuolar-type H+-ATPase subunit H
VAEDPVERPDDERLRELLAVERRLQDLVRAAHEDAGRRITAARAVSDERLAAAREAAKRADAERAEAERASHAAALAALQTAHHAMLARITAIADDRVDDLARWAVAQAIGEGGEAT